MGPTSSGPTSRAHFFTKLDMPKISLEDQQLHDSPLQLSKITAAIRSMHNGKSPGPDGFPVEFHKKFLDKIGSTNARYVSTITPAGHSAAHSHTGPISLIPKKGKDPLIISSNFTSVSRCQNSC